GAFCRSVSGSGLPPFPCLFPLRSPPDQSGWMKPAMQHDQPLEFCFAKTFHTLRILLLTLDDQMLLIEDDQDEPSFLYLLSLLLYSFYKIVEIYILVFF